MHPLRQNLAGAKEGEFYDLLLAVQSDLTRGSLGVDKPLSCSTSLLSKIAKLKPRSLDEMAKIIQKRQNIELLFYVLKNVISPFQQYLKIIFILTS